MLTKTMKSAKSQGKKKATVVKNKVAFVLDRSGSESENVEPPFFEGKK